MTTRRSVLRVGDRVLFGAAYYPEYQPEPRLEADLDLMQEAGFSLIRVGESVWSTWEPRDGELDLDWLEPVLDGAHARGIAVVLGTPTYAVPPWLMRKHPEIAAESATGVRVPWGARQEADVSHPVFRRYAERIVRAVVPRYVDHPAVVGFQVDNEPGQHLAHNAHVFERFKAWLLDTYGSTAAINDAWNLTHWAHRISDIDELWTPDGNHVPQYDLAWRRFQASLTTEYIDWQARIVREYARDDQFVTTCVDVGRPAVHDARLADTVDIAAGNTYLATQDGLAAGTDGDPAFPPSGSWAPFFAGDRTRAMSGERFLVTETNASSIGFPWFTHPAYDGQWRQIAWALVARGARGIGYWHWHTMHGSWETYWGGILPHSLRPGRVYREIARIGAEIRRAGRAVEGLAPDAGVGLVYSMPSRWALETHPPFGAAGTPAHQQGPPDRDAYERIVYRFHGGLSRAGHGVEMLHAERVETEDPVALAQRLPVLVVPATYLAGPDLLRTLDAYVAAGGHLVLGIRTAYADEVGRPRTEVQPAGLSDLAGVWYDELSNLTHPLGVTGELSGTAEAFLECLVPDGADVLARYDDQHFGRWPAATTRAVGAGRVTYVGAMPGLDLATDLGRWLRPDNPWQDQLVPGLVTAHGATNGDGERLWFLHNFGFEPQRLTVPVPVEDVLTDDRVEDVLLGPWDVRILREVAR